MGFWEFLNWMIDKLKQSVRLITMVCRGLYDLLCAEFSKIYNGAEQMKAYRPDPQTALNAAAYVGEVVITELLKGIQGGPIIRRFAQDGLRSLHGRMESGHGHLPNTVKEMQNRIEKPEEDNKLRTQQKKLRCKRIKQSASSSGTLHLGSNMEQKPEDVVKASLMKGFKAGVILVPVIVSKL